MIIRSEIVTRGYKVLENWQEASDFTKMYLILDWCGEVGGLTIYEIAVILFPELTSRTGAPTQIAVQKANGLKMRVRHSHLNDALVPFAMIKKIQGKDRKPVAQWLNMNIRDIGDWKKIVLMKTRIMEGHKNTIEKFDKMMEIPLSERFDRVQKFLEQKKRELEDEIRPELESESDRLAFKHSKKNRKTAKK